MSTIFISHSSADNALAVGLLDWLKTQGYRSVFLDLDLEEGIEAGERWEKVLYRELVSCSVVLALVTENWLASKWCFAEATHARSGGKTILGLTASRGVQLAILADTQSIDYSPDNRTDAYQRLAEALRRAIDPQGLGRWDPTRPLFPGLRFFDEQDAPIFFGRRRLGRAIYQKLRELQAKPPGSERLLLVFGPSGSGKSSVVRAGTLPHIHANPDAWITLGPFRPTEGWPEPLRQSMDVLAGSDEQAVAARLREIADQLRGEAKAPRATILLIIDQLEEALDAKDSAESAFWLSLSRLLAPGDTPFMAIATLRSDFMGDFQKRSARNAARFGSFPIEPMSPEDLREVIVWPCRVAGIAIEPGLVDALVEDAGDEQALPLLALALNRLWLRYEAKQGGFTVTDYRDGLGGMRGLIDREAESTLAGKGLREAAVLDAFLNLTRQVREGVLARNPANWDALEPEARKSLEPFIGARLLVRYSVEDEKFGAPGAKGAIVIDLVHENLLSGWTRFHDWLVRPEIRDFLAWREELRHKVIRWAQAEKRQGLSLQGPELKEAKKWLNAKRLALTRQEAAYIQAGIDANKISRVKLGVAASVLAAVAGGWWGWTRTDVYQIRAIESAFPETLRFAMSSDNYGSVDPFTLLTDLGHTELAITAADKMDNERQKAFALRDIAGRLAEAGQAQQALAAADKIDDARGKAFALRDIAGRLAEAGQTQQAVQVFKQALAAADKIDDAGWKADTLRDIAQALAKAGQAQQALAAADKIDGARGKAVALRDIAQALAKAGQTQQAVQVFKHALAAADKIDDAQGKAVILQRIAQALAKAGQTQQALAAADKIDDAGGKALALQGIAQALMEAGQAQQAVQVFKQALAAAAKIDDAQGKAFALQYIAQALVEAGQTQQALAAADKIDDAVGKAGTLQGIAQALADKGMMKQANPVLDKAVRITENISGERWKSQIYGNIAATYAQLTQYHPARVTAERAKLAGDTLNGYMAILKYYAIEQHPELAEKLAKLQKEDKLRYDD